MSRIRTTRKARQLREHVRQIKRMEASLLAGRIQIARSQVEHLREQLSPERRLSLSQGLAQWEAHLDSLEDDSVYAIPKGGE